jgi:hypothetical protein
MSRDTGCWQRKIPCVGSYSAVFFFSSFGEDLFRALGGDIRRSRDLSWKVLLGRVTDGEFGTLAGRPCAGPTCGFSEEHI